MSEGKSKGNNKEAAAAAGSSSSAKKVDTLLPQSKVKTIMKSSPEVEHIGVETLYLVTKATELFVEHLAKQSYQSAKGNKALGYKNLSDYIHKTDSMAFLRDIVPPKMTAKAALQEVAKQNAANNKEVLD